MTSHVLEPALVLVLNAGQAVSEGVIINRGVRARYYTCDRAVGRHVERQQGSGIGFVHKMAFSLVEDYINHHYPRTLLHRLAHDPSCFSRPARVSDYEPWPASSLFPDA